MTLMPATPFTGLGAIAPRVAGLVRPPETGTKAARARQALLDNGPLRGEQLASLVDVEGGNARIRALLKHDIDFGRVLHERGVYEINPGYEAAAANEISNAIRLLQRFGYVVRKGGRP